MKEVAVCSLSGQADMAVEQRTQALSHPPALPISQEAEQEAQVPTLRCRSARPLGA